MPRRTDAAGRRRIARMCAVAAGVVVLDQATKLLVERCFRLGESLSLIDGFLWLSHVRNPGVAFGMFAELAWKWRAPFFLVTAGLAVWLLWRLYREAGYLLGARVAMGMILGGALGNFVDRARYGMVVDFIEMGAGRWRFPTYNAADSCITIGTCLLLYTLWRAKKL